MIINKKKNLPAKQPNRNTSMYVFIYYTNNKRFCLGYYDFDSELWIDSDGMVIENDLLWCYLPVKQMKAFIQNMSNGNMRPRVFTIDGERYKMYNLEHNGERVNVASFALDNKIEQMHNDDRYDEVQHIDEMYSYYIPEDVDENNAEEVKAFLDAMYED